MYPNVDALQVVYNMNISTHAMLKFSQQVPLRLVIQLFLLIQLILALGM